ncbi:hypothetical protein Ddc_14034 [Ditylenchus destructor]|nr:hypothetical protein Ddc_14034 [Ditylenchus destructor]
MPTNRTFILIATALIFILIILEFSECSKKSDEEKRQKEKRRKHHSSHRESVPSSVRGDSRRDSHRSSHHRDSHHESSRLNGSSALVKKSKKQPLPTSADIAKEEWGKIKNLLRFKKAKFLTGVDKNDTKREIIDEGTEKVTRSLMGKVLPKLANKVGTLYGTALYKARKGKAEVDMYTLVRSKEFKECMVGKGSSFACQWLSVIPGNTPEEAIENLAKSKKKDSLLKLFYYTGRALRKMRKKRKGEKVDPKDLDSAIINGLLQELKQTQMGELSKLAAELEVSITSFFDSCISYLSDVVDNAVNALISAFGDVELNSYELENVDYLAFHD